MSEQQVQISQTEDSQTQQQAGDIDLDQFQEQCTEDFQTDNSEINHSQQIQQQQQLDNSGYQNNVVSDLNFNSKSTSQQQYQSQQQQPQQFQQEFSSYNTDTLVHKLNKLENEIIDQQINQKQLIEDKEAKVDQNDIEKEKEQSMQSEKAQQNSKEQMYNNIQKEINNNNFTTSSNSQLMDNSKQKSSIQGDISMRQFQEESSKKSDNNYSEQQFDKWVLNQKQQQVMQQKQLDLQNLQHQQQIYQKQHQNQNNIQQEQYIQVQQQQQQQQQNIDIPPHPISNIKSSAKKIKLKDLCQDEKIKIGQLIEKIAVEKEERQYYQQICKQYQQKYDDILIQMQSQNQQFIQQIQHLEYSYEKKLNDVQKQSESFQNKIEIQEQKIENLEKRLVDQRKMDQIYASNINYTGNSPKNNLFTNYTYGNSEIQDLKQDIKVLSQSIEIFLQKESKNSPKQNPESQFQNSTYRSNANELTFSQLQSRNNKLIQSTNRSNSSVPYKNHYQLQSSQQQDSIKELNNSTQDALTITNEKVLLAKEWVHQKKKEVDEMIRSISPTKIQKIQFSNNNNIDNNYVNNLQYLNDSANNSTCNKNIQNQGIGYVNIYVNKIDQSVLFYTKILKFEVAFDQKQEKSKQNKQQRTVFLLPQNHNQSQQCPMLKLIKSDNKQQQISKNNHTVLSLYTNSFWEDYKFMLKCQINFMGQPAYNEIFDSMVVQFFDCNGNKIELIEQQQQQQQQQIKDDIQYPIY